MSTWIAECDGAGDDALRMDRAIAKLRDEVTGVAMLRHNGHNRELAFVMAKLDEARMWTLEYFQTTGRIVPIDKADFETTRATVATESETPNGRP